MIIEITSFSDPRISPYCRLTEAQLRSRLDPASSMMIVESPKVIATALDAGLTPLSLLCEPRHIEGDAAAVIGRCGDIDVFTGSRAILESITGYRLTRGVLCAMRRPAAPTLEEVLDGARRVCVIDGVTDTTNIGAIFRSAAALGVDAVLLTPTSCDPFNRRSIRVSMGTVFQVPWTWIEPPVTESLHRFGFRTVAMALTDRSVPIDNEELRREKRLAIIMGTEGDGLADDVIAAADYTARIPMFHGVDSLNVAAASAVAFWELRIRQEDCIQREPGNSSRR